MISHLIEDTWRILRLAALSALFVLALGSEWALLTPVFLLAEVLNTQEERGLARLGAWLLRAGSIIPFSYLVFMQRIRLMPLRIDLRALTGTVYIVQTSLMLVSIIIIDLIFVLIALIGLKRRS